MRILIESDKPIKTLNLEFADDDDGPKTSATFSSEGQSKEEILSDPKLPDLDDVEDSSDLTSKLYDRMGEVALNSGQSTSDDVAEIESEVEENKKDRPPDIDPEFSGSGW